jgi:hypothetical protein
VPGGAAPPPTAGHLPRACAGPRPSTGNGLGAARSPARQAPRDRTKAGLTPREPPVRLSTSRAGEERTPLAPRAGALLAATTAPPTAPPPLGRCPAPGRSQALGSPRTASGAAAAVATRGSREAAGVRDTRRDRQPVTLSAGFLPKQFQAAAVRLCFQLLLPTCFLACRPYAVFRLLEEICVRRYPDVQALCSSQPRVSNLRQLFLWHDFS